MVYLGSWCSTVSDSSYTKLIVTSARACPVYFFFLIMSSYRDKGILCMSMHMCHLDLDWHVDILKTDIQSGWSSSTVLFNWPHHERDNSTGFINGWGTQLKYVVDFIVICTNKFYISGILWSCPLKTTAVWASRGIWQSRLEKLLEVTAFLSFFPSFLKHDTSFWRYYLVNCLWR